MYPKNKTQLKKWFKENVGARLTLQYGQRIFELDGVTQIADTLSDPLTRIVNHVQTNAVNFLGQRINRQTGEIEDMKNPSWKWFDQKDEVYFFDEKGFTCHLPMTEATKLIDGEHKRIKGYDYLRYEFVVETTNQESTACLLCLGSVDDGKHDFDATQNIFICPVAE